MSTEVDLLRMLEPAVRPGGVPGPNRSQRVPIESRDFQSLLEEARNLADDTPPPGDDAASSDGASRPGRDGLIDQLAGVQRVENSSLRQLLQRVASPSGSAAADNGQEQPIPNGS